MISTELKNKKNHQRYELNLEYLNKHLGKRLGIIFRNEIFILILEKKDPKNPQKSLFDIMNKASVICDLDEQRYIKHRTSRPRIMVPEEKEIFEAFGQVVTIKEFIYRVRFFDDEFEM